MAADGKDKTELWMLKSRQHQEEAGYQLRGSLSDQPHNCLLRFPES